MREVEGLIDPEFGESAPPMAEQFGMPSAAWASTQLELDAVARRVSDGELSESDALPIRNRLIQDQILALFPGHELIIERRGGKG